MNTTSSGLDEESRSGSKELGGRVICVVPVEAAATAAADEGSILDALSALWRRRWSVVGFTALATGVALAYVFLAPKYYRAEVLLMPVSTNPNEGLAGRLGGLGGLASLAGISIGGGNTAEPVATLNSSGFARAFIEEHGLIPVLFADDWDAKDGKWKSTDPSDWPDIRDAVRYFERDVRTVKEDKKTGLVTLAVEWKDPDTAAEWANLMADSINARMRTRALLETEANLKYLTSELADSKYVALQEALGRLIESEQQKLMLARGRMDFSFRVIDRAESPKRPSRPKRAQTVALAAIAGAMLSVLVVLAWEALRRQRVSADSLGDSRNELAKAQC